MEYGRKIIYYVRNCEECSDKLTILKHDVFTIDFLTDAGVLYRVKMENRIRQVNFLKNRKVNFLTT